MSMRQTIVWIDAREAQILRVELGVRYESSIAAPDGEQWQGQPDVFFEQIATALATADELLVVGPSALKHEFVKYMHGRCHGVDSRILGVEAVNNPDDDQITGYANVYFTECTPGRSGQGSGYREETD